MISNRICWEWVNCLIIIKSIQLMFVNYVNRIWLIIPLLLLVMRLFVVVKKIPSFILITLIMVLTKCPLSQDLSMIVICRVVYSLGFHFYVIPHEFGVDIPHKPFVILLFIWLLEQRWLACLKKVWIIMKWKNWKQIIYVVYTIE